MQNKPLVSVVITTKNEESNIENCLISIKEQDYKNIETILVDNNSTDSTKKIASRYNIIISNKGPERSAQRNHGLIDLASGSYLMFIDADMILGQNLISSAIDKVLGNNIDGLYIPETILGSRLFNRIRRFERNFYIGSDIDAIRFFSRDKFIKTGGFDESLTGPEDWDFDYRFRQCGKVSVLEESLLIKDSWSLYSFIHQNLDQGDNIYSSHIFHNETNIGLREFLNKKCYYLNSFENYKNKWKGNKKVYANQLSIFYRLFFVFLEKQKYKKFLKKPFLAFLVILLKLITFLSTLKCSIKKKCI